MPSRLLRIVFSFPVFLGAVLAAITFYFANRGVADPDIWWHLRNAEYLLKNHHFIRVDMYSFTVPGVPWMNHEWLAEIPYYLGWWGFGYRGIFAVMMVLIEVVVLGIYWLGTLVSGNAKSGFVACWLAVFLATVSFGPRTLLLGWIYLILLIAILWRFKERGRANVWIIPILFLFWVNSHGSWLIGMVVLWIFILSGWKGFTTPGLQARPWSPLQMRRILKVAAASILALFVNPYGYKLVVYPFDLALRQKLNIGNIEEWASPDFHSLRGKILLGSIFLVLVLVVIRRQRWRLEWFALFLLATYSSITYLRFLFLAGIILTPIIASRLDIFPPYEKEKDKPLVNALFVALALAFVIWKLPSEKALRAEVERTYPAQALPLLQERVRQQPGRVFNSYLWGGYMILHSRDIPVFIDSRTDIYEYHGVLKDYIDFINLQNSLGVLDKYQANYVFLETHSSQAYFMNHVADWHPVYKDDQATLYARTPK